MISTGGAEADIAIGAAAVVFLLYSVDDAFDEGDASQDNTAYSIGRTEQSVRCIPHWQYG